VRADFDLVHTLIGHANVVGLVAAALARQRRVLASQRSLHPVSGSFRDASPAMVAVGRWLFRHVARRVVVNNPAIADALHREGFPPDRVVTISNGIDLARFGPATDRTVARRALGLDADLSIVGFAGRMIPDKGLGRLLDAAERLVDAHPGLAILAAGDGPERAALEARAADPPLAGRVRFLGLRNDLERFYPLLDVFAFPSTYSEGTPNVVLEAMACAVPVVAHRMVQMEEMVRNGDTGVLVDSTSPEALAAALGSLLADPLRAASIGRAGREHVRRNYALETMLRQTESLYETELAG
jgi:glycosyltransferase involved in cell wall biosynthesis